MNAGITKARVDSLNPRKPLYVEKDATVADVVAMMEQTKSGCILVRDKGALIGTLSERTILRNLIAMHMEFSHTPVTRLMSTDTHCLYADDSAEYALNEMTFGGFRNITVLSQVGDPSGILTFEDILDHILAKMHVRLDTEEKKPRSSEKKRAREKQGIDPEDFDRPIGVLDPPAALCVESGGLLKDAVRQMADRNIGCVMVVRDKKLIGTVTERFLLYKIAYETPDFDTAKVDDYMRVAPQCLQMHDPISAAIRILALHDVRHIPIVNENGEPVAFTSVRGVIDYIVSFYPDEIINLPPHPMRFGLRDEAGA